jgi:hypothetical protein
VISSAQANRLPSGQHSLKMPCVVRFSDSVRASLFRLHQFLKNSSCRLKFRSQRSQELLKRRLLLSDHARQRSSAESKSLASPLERNVPVKIFEEKINESA